MIRPHDIGHRTCRHWRGCMIRVCGAGLTPRDLAGGAALGWVLRVPCAGRHGRAGMPWTPCERYEPRGMQEGSLTAENAENAERNK